MPRFNVEDNGEWACFSSIVDDFVTKFMSKEQYEEWRKKEYGIVNYEPAEKCNIQSFRECLFAMKLNRTDKEFCDCLREAGIIDKGKDTNNGNEIEEFCKLRREISALQKQLKHYTEPQSVEWEDVVTRVCPCCKQKSYYCASRDEKFVKQPDNYCSKCGQRFKVET